ncbi:MAG TPA: hypothetical protein VM690_06295, partial [Gaiellaceae bacterium]|nr:hypothetical protein [Gaiellaceae bacterium]
MLAFDVDVHEWLDCAVEQETLAQARECLHECVQYLAHCRSGDIHIAPSADFGAKNGRYSDAR